jgi:hypothetical protein
MMGLSSRSGRANTAVLDSRNLWGSMLQLRIRIQLREQLEGRICPSSSMLSMLGVSTPLVLRSRSCSLFSPTSAPYSKTFYIRLRVCWLESWKMAEVLQPTAPPQASNRLESKQVLQRWLDDLLERYINLLDQYQTLQQELKENLSNGYLSLAQANFLNVNRIRYGQDYYDDRMQATAWLSVNESRPYFSTATHPIPQSPKLSGPNEAENDTPRMMKNGETKASSGDSEKGSVVPCDPLHWFGILVPPALRASQFSFKRAIVDSIPALASISKEMKELEIEIRRARKKLRKIG